MRKILLAASLALPMAALQVQAQDKPLSADEIRALVTGKTLDFAAGATGFSAILALEAGGAGSGSFMSSQNPRANYSSALKWQVNDKGEFCTVAQRTGSTEKCTLVQKAENGTYDRLLEGKVDSTFKVR